MEIYDKIVSVKQGFTLIELLVVISIIGLLSSIVLTSLNSARLNARNAVYRAEKNEAIKALQQYYFANGNYPNSSGWRCFGWPTSDRCWSNSYTGLDSLQTAVSPYLSGRIEPGVGTHGQALLYNSAQGGLSGYPSGAYLIWAVEGLNMPDSECRGYKVTMSGDNYCYEYVGS